MTVRVISGIGIVYSVLRLCFNEYGGMQEPMLPVLNYPRGDYVITGVGLSVCLSVCLFVTTITK